MPSPLSVVPTRGVIVSSSANKSIEDDVSAAEVDLRGLEGVPLEAEEGMLGLVAGELDLLGHCVTAGDGGVARAVRGVVDGDAAAAVGVAFAAKPIGVLASGFGAIRATGAVVSGNIGAGKDTLLKARLGLVLLRDSGNVVGVQELVDDILVLADPVAEHAAVVTVVVNAPHDLDSLTSCVGGNGGVSPGCSGRVVVVATPFIVTARAALVDLHLVQIRPRFHRL